MANSYDPKRVSVIVDGHIVTGFMDGTFITSAKNSDNVIPHVGADGLVTYTENADGTGTITVTIKQDSPSLSKFIQLSNSRREFTTRVVDSNGEGKFRAGGTQCRVLRTPDLERAAEVSGVEVTIHVADYAVS